MSNVIDVFVLNFIYKLFWHQKDKKNEKKNIYLKLFCNNTSGEVKICFLLQFYS